MVDPITLVIAAGFGGLALVVILGFLLILRRNRISFSGDNPRSAYETRDYYRQYGPRKTPETRYTYEQGHRPFRSDAEIEANAQRVRANARAIMTVIVVVALAAVIIAGVFDPTNLILLIFLVPIALSFLWSRRNRANPEERDGRS